MELLGPPVTRTDAEREAAFQRYIESTEKYFAAVVARGDEPWHGGVEARRELFNRRYIRPAPLAGLPRSTWP